MPVWRWDGEFAEEAIEKSYLVLIPLMLWRRARLGGVCRPAELLLVACGTPLVVDNIDWALWASESRFEIDSAGNLGGLFSQCHTATWIVCLAASLMLSLRRRSMGYVVCSALMTLAVATSFAWFLMPMENLNVYLATRCRLGPTGETALAVATRSAMFLVPSLLAGAAIRDAFRRSHLMTGLEWAGFAARRMRPGCCPAGQPLGTLRAGDPTAARGPASRHVLRRPARSEPPRRATRSNDRGALGSPIKLEPSRFQHK